MQFKHLDKTIRALDKSRKGKWAKLVAGKGRSEPHCLLCDVGYGSCNGCVIRCVTGKQGCASTPHVDWNAAAESHCSTCPHDGADKCPDPCPTTYNTQEAKKHARRESKMLGAIQKGLEVMQRELAKIK